MGAAESDGGRPSFIEAAATVQMEFKKIEINKRKVRNKKWNLKTVKQG